jgi:hypothetical protein
MKEKVMEYTIIVYEAEEGDTGARCLRSRGADPRAKPLKR